MTIEFLNSFGALGFLITLPRCAEKAERRLWDKSLRILILWSAFMFEPTEVKKDKMGYWAHPAFEKEEYDDLPLSEIPEAEGMEFKFRQYDEEKWLASDGQCDVSDWEPKTPEGERWFLGGIYENEEGVWAMFARPMTKCPDCGHEHSGIQYAYICIGCPCETRPIALAE